ncbi:MAG: YfcE family phosphodiesterase [Phycisphaeraceae bacterium]
MESPLAIIGLISDSHGSAGVTARAVAALVDAEPLDMLVHLGDIGSEQVIDAMAVGLDAGGGLVPPVRIVFGNTDYDTASLSRYARTLGVIVDDIAGRLTLDGKTIVYTHGDRAQLVQDALDEGVDYLLHGHTHRATDRRVGRTRVINPGALHRASSYTAALLDVAADRLRFVQVPKA